MATPSYPNHLKLTKINSETVNGYDGWASAAAAPERQMKKVAASELYFPFRPSSITRMT
jgi:hypothetical protein